MHKGQTLGKESQNSLCHGRQLVGFSKMLKARRKSGIKAASEWVCYLDRKEDVAREALSDYVSTFALLIRSANSQYSPS